MAAKRLGLGYWGRTYVRSGATPHSTLHRWESGYPTVPYRTVPYRTVTVPYWSEKKPYMV
ncbi:hypothetical protein DM02DRAFT_611364 [Periconia macrospinosa]|uniref:Uncharacterized protein n=1 Tax=Periconia macrospinosa TaxID=97972 RepID=A0A2V1E3N9_9PLEO|nr:hypothetical protein DM02DRAFT_611364 [Periconia macrospinosa]